MACNKSCLNQRNESLFKKNVLMIKILIRLLIMFNSMTNGFRRNLYI